MEFAPNLFESVDDAQAFFERFGLSVERRSFEEVLDHLISPQRLNLSTEQSKRC